MKKMKEELEGQGQSGQVVKKGDEKPQKVESGYGEGDVNSYVGK